MSSVLSRRPPGSLDQGCSPGHAHPPWPMDNRKFTWRPGSLITPNPKIQVGTW